MRLALLLLRGAGALVGTLLLAGGCDDSERPPLRQDGQLDNPCPADALWSQRFGDAAAQDGVRVEATADGSIYVMGYFSGSTDFGLGPMVANGDFDRFVVKFDCAGSPIWQQQLPLAGTGWGRELAVGSDGIVVVGKVVRDSTIGERSVPADANVMMKLRHDGTLSWISTFGGDFSFAAVSLHPSGAVAVAGSLWEPTDLGGGVLPASAASNFFVAGFDAEGHHVFSWSDGSSADELSLEWISVNASGRLLVGGSEDSTTCVEPMDCGTTFAAFVAMFEPGSPDPLWRYDWTETVFTSTGVLLDDGAAYVVRLPDTFDETVIHRLSPSGTLELSRSFPVGIADLETTPSGDLYIAGPLSTPTDFGGGLLQPIGPGPDLFVVRLDSQARHLQSSMFQAASIEASNIAVDSAGAILLTGGFLQAIDVGTGPLQSAGDADVFVARTSLDAPTSAVDPRCGEPGSGPRVPDVTAGDNFSCAALEDGTVRCWGDNKWTQLGVDDLVELGSDFPVPAEGIVGAAQLAAGDEHTCVRHADSTVSCWGINSHGSVGLAGDDGEIMPWCIGLAGVRAVDASGWRTCALMENGTVWCWGPESEADGSGSIYVASPTKVSGIDDAVQVSTGQSHTCALRSDSTVVCWGKNWDGELGNGTISDAPMPPTAAAIRGVTHISAGGSMTCAVHDGGLVSCWGRNIYNVLGLESQTPWPLPTPIAGIVDAVQVETGRDWVCARSAHETNGRTSLRCWGNWFPGKPEGADPDSTEPLAVAGLPGPITDVAIGGGHMCAVASGTVYCWGDNLYGQLGAGRDSKDVPVPVAF